MTALRSALDRLLPALITAGGVTLVVAGLLLFYAARWADIAGLALGAAVVAAHWTRRRE